MHGGESHIVSMVENDFEQAFAMRGNWINHWQEIAERIHPQASREFRNTQSTKGTPRNEFILDATGVLALNRFAAIIDSLLTPRNQTWHKLTSFNKDIKNNRQARMWFEEVNKVLFKYRYLPDANFAAQNFSNNKALGAFGSGAIFIDPLVQPGGGLRYRDCHLGTVYFMENHQGIVDKVIRRYWMTARQLMQRELWRDKLPNSVLSKVDTGAEETFEVLHWVGPNLAQDPTALDHNGMRYKSYYVLREGKALLDVGGYHVMPYAISRYEQAPNEVYGRSPAMDALPSIKTLNEQKKALLKQAHRTVDPILLTHDDGVLDSFSMEPGALNAGGVSREGRSLVQTLPIGRVDVGIDAMNMEKDVINDMFLVSLFQILTDNPQQTATEVIERTKEKGILLAPTIGRQESEKLGPMIERELDLLAQQELLPEMPPLLKEMGDELQFEIIYDSPLSRTQRAGEASGLIRTLEVANNYANVTGDVSVYDYINMDTAMPDLADINAMPIKWRRTVEDVDRIRQGRAQQQQQQQEIEAAPAVAGLMKNAPGGQGGS